MDDFSGWIARPGALAPILAVAVLGYVLGMLVTRRERPPAAWLAMIVLAPFIAFVSSTVAFILQLAFFIMTFGGEIKGAQMPLSMLAAVVLAMLFGVWAAVRQDWVFRAMCYFAAVVVGLYVLFIHAAP